MKADNTVFYNNKHIDKDHFRVFVYDKDNKTKLANSYDEYLELTATGLWFDQKATITIDKPKYIRPSRAKPKAIKKDD